MMLSRTAESIYWMNRYVERAENYARLVGVNLLLSLDLPSGVDSQWQPLVMTTGDDADFEERYGEFDRDSVLRFLVFDEQNPNSIRSCLAAARENARSVREVISSEMWNQLNDMYLLAEETAERRQLPDEEVTRFLQTVRMGSHLFCGIMDSTFSHGEGYNFGSLGRHLERADKTTRIVDMKYFFLLPSPRDVDTTIDLLHWTALLRSASAFEMYRKAHGNADPKKIAAFLLLDRQFPRSVYACLRHASEALDRASEDTHQADDTIRELGKLTSELEYAVMQDIFNIGLHEFLDGLQTRLNGVGAGIADAFFVAYA